MQYVRLGRTGLQVSRLCLGTMNFGPLTSEADSFAIMDRALELGINFFDTANVYGWKTGEGVTEQIIGRWLAQGGGRRDRIVLATKVYGRMGTGPNDTRLSALHIRRACDESLRRLQTDHRSLPDAPRGSEHAVGRDSAGVRRAIAQGKVIYAGSSNSRRLAHRAGEWRDRERHAPAGLRAEPLQSHRAHDRARGHPVVPGARARRDPSWSPLAGGSARRRAPAS